VALTASENVQMMAELIQEFRQSYAVMRDQRKAEELRGAVPSSDCEILCGMDGFIRVSTLPRVEMVVAAMFTFTRRISPFLWWTLYIVFMQSSIYSMKHDYKHGTVKDRVQSPNIMAVP